MPAEFCQNLPLRPKQSKLLEELLTSPTVAAAAERASVPLRTAYRWLNESPGFRQAYRSGKRAAIEQAVVSLSAGAAAAAAVLMELVSDPGTPATVRAQSASKVLDLVFRSVELDDLAGRIEALESQAGPLSVVPTNGKVAG